LRHTAAAPTAAAAAVPVGWQACTHSFRQPHTHTSRQHGTWQSAQTCSMLGPRSMSPSV
jgi:hypothetical protein